MATYNHLSYFREEKYNRRRSKTPPRFAKQDDLVGHGQKLNAYFAKAVSVAKQQVKSSSDSPYVLKLKYDGAMTFDNLKAHGLEFISQESNQICIVFATEEGLATFQDHIAKLGFSEKSFSYKQILEAIETIENWSNEDRKCWAIKNYGIPTEDFIQLDVELWPIDVINHPSRLKLCGNFEKWLKSNNIKKIDRINLDSLLMYRIEINAGQVDLILNHCDVRYVDLLPATGINFPQLNRDIADLPDYIPSPPPLSSKICILDSGINTNHPLLRSSIAESRSFIDGEDEFDDVGHGTAVAGIALYGDVENCDSSNYWNPEVWIYNGKIMRKCPSTGNAIYDSGTLEKTLSNAVEYFYEQGCRIFNLSIGNLNSPYDGKHVKGLAYIIDVLARKYNVLFVISTGNFHGSDDPAVPTESWRDEYPDYLLNQASTLIDPAPALNALTVGSIARHNATFDSQRYSEIHQLSPASENQPSPFTRHGPSVKGALKPELVAAGGNLASPMRQEGNQWKSDMRGLGVLTFNNKFQGNTLFKETCGTSFSAPYISHLAGRLLNIYPDASANTLRALLVNHSFMCNEISETFSEAMKTAYKKNKETYNREIARDVAGYGCVSESDLFKSSDHCVVLMSEEVIENDSCQFFELPLPSGFVRSKRSSRELTITLAHSPAVRTTRIDYTATQIYYRLVKGLSLEEVQKSFDYKNQKEEKSRNDDSTTNREISAQLRSKGTVQSSRWKFKQLNPKYKWFVVVTRQDREWTHQDVKENEKYSLIITVSDRENEHAQLFTEIKNIVKQKVKIREEIRHKI